MAKKKSNVENFEMDYIRQREAHLDMLIGAIQKVSQFKKGDFLIAFRPANAWSKRTQYMNSYGAPKKYQVVYTDKYGVPYMKELNKNGHAIGSLISTLRFQEDTRVSLETNYEFEVDPDYADAIIMDEEANYNATSLNKAKSDAFKEITEHNKSLKLKFKDNVELLQFLKTLKVGDVFWKSIKTSFVIQSIDPIPTTHFGRRLTEHVPFGTAKDSKGKEFKIDSTTFKWRAVYTAQPRSYNELKDPK